MYPLPQHLKILVPCLDCLSEEVQVDPSPTFESPGFKSGLFDRFVTLNVSHIQLYLIVFYRRMKSIECDRSYEVDFLQFICSPLCSSRAWTERTS